MTNQPDAPPPQNQLPQAMAESQAIDSSDDSALKECSPVQYCPEPSWRQRLACGYRDSLWGYPELFCERPFGSIVNAHVQNQVFAGWADQMVLYRYDFVDERGLPGVSLNTRGRDQLAKLTEIQERTGLTLTIERSVGNPGLDQARRRFVLGTLGLPEDSQMVVVGKPRAFGLSGNEGILLYQNRLDQTQNRGMQRLSRGLTIPGRSR
jgi:hypothetical protein